MFGVSTRATGLRVAATALVSSAVLFGAASASAMTVTSTGEGGSCSLRMAIDAVNNGTAGSPCGAVAGGGAVTQINLPANTYTPTDAQLQVKAGAKIEIVGANINNPHMTVIDPTTNISPHRVFEVLAGGQLKLTGLEVTGGRTLNGADGQFYGDSADQGAGILNRGSVTLDHVTLTGNFTGAGGAGGNGGFNSDHRGYPAGLGGNGGGISNLNGASLTITSSTISGNGTGRGGNGGNGGDGVNGSGNFAKGGPGGAGGQSGDGGGIWNQGTVSITNSTVSGNFTGRGGNGGDGGRGAGPLTDGGTTFGSGAGGDGGDGGSSGYKRYEYCQCYSSIPGMTGGGGISNTGGGVLTITNSTISGNSTGAGGNGGGAGVGGPDQNGHSVTGSHGGFAGSGGFGGGIYTAFGKTTLTNVTMSGNVAGDGGTGGNGPTTGSLGPGPGGYGGHGGAIWAAGAKSPYFVALTHVTISKNTAGDGGPAGAPGAPPSGSGPFPGTPGVRGIGTGIAIGGRYDPAGTSVSLKNTIVTDNGLVTDSNCTETSATPTNYADLGGNLTNGTTCPGTNGNAMLGLLQNNGGPTQTMLPASGSAAIGAITSGCSSVPTDQRGFPRPGSGSVCDIGAVETGAAPPLTPTSMSLSSSANPSTAGQQVSYTATVAPPPGAGTVTFTDGGSPISGCTTMSLSGGGQAVCPVTYSSAGSHSIGATYTGTSVYGASSATPLSQVVDNAPSPKTLTVGKNGSGTVTSAPAGIDCGATCSATYAPGTVVTLTAVAASGSTFTGWSGGGCAGTGPCQVTVSGDTGIGATFTTDTPPPPDTTACDNAKKKVAAATRRVSTASKALANAKKARHPSQPKIKRLRAALAKAKSVLAKDRAAQKKACG